jgi:adenylate cyclase
VGYPIVLADPASDGMQHAVRSRRARRCTPLRVERGVAFVDLCGFTDFADDHGDDEAAEVLHLLRASLREAAASHGVRVDKWLGDGAMLVTVEVPPLLSAVVEAKCDLTEQIPLRLRGGVTAGPVMVFEGDDYVGRSVNLAARLCEAAEADQVLATADLAVACPVDVEATPDGLRRLHGFHEPIDVVSIRARLDDVSGHSRGLAAAHGRSTGGDRQRSSSSPRRQLRLLGE